MDEREKQELIPVSIDIHLLYAEIESLSDRMYFDFLYLIKPVSLADLFM